MLSSEESANVLIRERGAETDVGACVRGGPGELGQKDHQSLGPGHLLGRKHRVRGMLFSTRRTPSRRRWRGGGGGWWERGGGGGRAQGEERDGSGSGLSRGQPAENAELLDNALCNNTQSKVGTRNKNSEQKEERER